MNRKFFNFKLYVDMLRQLRVMGIVFGALCIVASVVPVIVNAVDVQNGNGFFTPTPAQLTPALMVFMGLGGLAFPLAAFSFLNKRAASDFYHSLPDSRVCTYVSILSAVLSWLYTIIISTALITWFAYAVSSLPYNAAYFPWLIADYLAAVTFVAGAVLIAAGVTGTLFTNIVVAGLVIFLPRIIFLLFSTTVVSIARIVPPSELGVFFGTSTNIVTGLIFGGMLGTPRLSDTLLNGTGIIYTAVVGVVYMALGGLLFRFRKSELAGRSAPNRVLQHVYRCTLTLPFLLLIAMGVSGTTQYIPAYIGDNGVAFLIVFLVSLAVYFLFELVTTRKAKNLLSAAPWYLAVVALAVVFGVGAGALGRVMLHTTPSAQEIQYVKMGFSYSGNYMYNDILLGKIRYDDPRIRQLISDGLKYTVSVETGARMEGDITGSYTLGLIDGRAITRTIYLRWEDWERLTGLRAENSQYKSGFRKLPDDNEISGVYIRGLNDDAARKIWGIYRQEVQSLTDAQYELAKDGSSPSPATLPENAATGSYTFFEIAVQGSIGLENYQSVYYVSTLTPRAADACMEALFHEAASGMRKNIGLILNDQDGQNGFSWTVTLLNAKDDTGKNPSGFRFSYSHFIDQPVDAARRDVSDRLLHILWDSGLKPGRLGAPMAVITFGAANYDQDAFFVELTPEQARSIMDIGGPYNTIPV